MMRHVIPVLAVALLAAAETIPVPVQDGGWWQIGDQKPDLGPWSSPDEDACDFTIFKAADGTWQMIGCVRGCTWPTGNRIFHRWEGRSLEDRDWAPKGVFLTPDKALEQVSAIQAPHGFVHQGVWHLFYNAATGFGKPTPMGNSAYAMTSADGKAFTHRPAADGKPGHFPMGRDLNLFRDDDGTWYATYCGRVAPPPGQKPGPDTMVCRSAPSLDGPWSEARSLGMTSGNPESPFILKRQGRYYLWQQMSVYVSDRPDRFAGDPVTVLKPGWKWAPEVIEDQGRWYMAAYGRGLFMARLRWEERTPAQIAAWQQGELVQLRAEEEGRNRRAQEAAERKRREAPAP